MRSAGIRRRFSFRVRRRGWIVCRLFLFAVIVDINGLRGRRSREEEEEREGGRGGREGILWREKVSVLIIYCLDYENKGGKECFFTAHNKQLRINYSTTASFDVSEQQ